ncbi:MAG: hypothetical protein IK092_03940, partial [Muribaculaceae bacterium]|nr:hypothetical protein [Muribaculaceae bacterium]
MKAKFYIASLCVLGASVVSFAQGYKDGIDFYNIGDYENAKVIFDRNPANNQPEYNYYQGAVALKTGDVKAAQSYFDKGIAADPTYPYNFVGKAAIALKNGNKSEGEELIKAARKLSKKDSKLEIAIARAYYDADPTANAKSIQKCMKDARKWNAKSPDLCNFEGDTYADQEQWGDAAAQYEWAMTYD